MILSGEGTVRELLVDSEHIYWLAVGTDALGNPVPGVLRQSTLDGRFVRSLAEGLDGPGELRQDDTHLYWVSARAVYRVAKHGLSEVEQVATNIAPLSNGLAVNGSRLFFRAAVGVLRSTTPSGSDPVDLTIEPIYGFTADDEFLYVFGSSYQRYPVSGGSPETIAAFDDYTYWQPILIRDAHLYAETHNYSIAELDAEDFSERVVLRTDDAVVTWFEVNGGEIFAALVKDDVARIVRAPLDPPEPETEVWRSAQPDGPNARSLSVTADADFVYWANGFDGTLHRRAR